MSNTFFSSSKSAIEAVHSLMSQVIKDKLFNHVGKTTPSSWASQGVQWEQTSHTAAGHTGGQIMDILLTFCNSRGLAS